MKRCVSEVIRCLKCDESMTVCDCVRHVRGVYRLGCVVFTVCAHVGKIKTRRGCE